MYILYVCGVIDIVCRQSVFVNNLLVLIIHRFTFIKTTDKINVSNICNYDIVNNSVFKF